MEGIVMINRIRLLTTNALLLALLIGGSLSASAQRRGYGDRPDAASRLTGTFRLDPSQSDDAQRMISQATRGLAAQDQDRVSQMLQRRLDAPEVLAIQRDGRDVTVASSLASQVT